jgi:hypothetical protein
MAAGIASCRGETQQHARLKRLAFLWAQAQGFTACGMEVTLPKCRYRADVAAWRRKRNQIGTTAILECKQALCDLRRDNCHSKTAQERLEALCRRRQFFESRLHAHYPSLHDGDSLFPEFDSQNFIAIGHRGYTRVLRELHALQNRLFDCTKFEKLTRYGCANFLFLVVAENLYRDSEIPVGWGALVESNGALELRRKPIWHETTPQSRLDLLQRIAMTGTRSVNREFGIALGQIQCMRCRDWGRVTPLRGGHGHK